MDSKFWIERWENNDIAFHEVDANTMLVKYFSTLSLKRNNRVFLPLCGKTGDINWLLSKGYKVVGVELIETAIQQLFIELGIEPIVSKVGKNLHYHADNIDIYVGDLFEISGNDLGAVDAVYDRAALVALPKEMRSTYASHIINITNSAKQLLVTYEYDQNLLNGPPFSISSEEVNQYYASNYFLTALDKVDVKGGLKGKCIASECVWLLKH